VTFLDLKQAGESTKVLKAARDALVEATETKKTKSLLKKKISSRSTVEAVLDELGILEPESMSILSSSSTSSASRRHDPQCPEQMGKRGHCRSSGPGPHRRIDALPLFSNNAGECLSPDFLMLRTKAEHQFGDVALVHCFGNVICLVHPKQPLPLI
jgi:hypothetical protein